VYGPRLTQGAGLEKRAALMAAQDLTDRIAAMLT
jgi:hypothetical protein